MHLNDLMYRFYSMAVGQSVVLVTAGAVVATSPIDVTGANSYTVSVQGISGADVYRIEGRIDGLPFYTVQDTIIADQHYTFTGVYDALQVVKVSGTGEDAAVSLRYGR